MGQIRRTSNPTGLRKIDRQNFAVRLVGGPNGERAFFLERFNSEAAQMNHSALVACVAHAGSTEEYFRLGSVSELDQRCLSIERLATDRPLRFRFLFSESETSRLIGYADDVTAVNDGGEFGSSLVDIEPAELRGPVWVLRLPESSGSDAKPNLLIERSIFPTAIAAASHSWFTALVMPEVMRRICLAITDDMEALNESGTWISSWRDFLVGIGADVEQTFDEDDDELRLSWSDDVVARFTAKSTYRTSVASIITELGGAND